MKNKEHTILNEIKLREQADVPNNYFSNISTSILSKIDRIEEPVAEKSYQIRWGFIAACASIILFLGLQLNSNDSEFSLSNQNEMTQLAMNEDQEEIADFLNEFIDFELSEIEIDLEEI